MMLQQMMFIAVLMTAILTLSACSGQTAALAPATATGQPAATQSDQPAAVEPTRPGFASGDLKRTNESGSVTFEVMPLNLGSGASTLDLNLTMSTHSVELGAFDLSKLAVLKTDTGIEIAPSIYKGGSGHHVEGKLSFPANKLAGAKTLTLIIRDVAGVAERTFTWNVP